MPRVQSIIAGGGRNHQPPARAAVNGPQPGEIADTLLLKFDDRRRQQGFVFGGKGTCVEFDFPEPPHLRTDDLLVLDDGRLAEVVADIEPVIEVRAHDRGKEPGKDFAAVARLVLALGNRHVPVQIFDNHIRLQKSPEIEALVARHGLKAVAMAAPFEPDDGGHDGHTHDHGHHHHGDGHSHHHHHHEK